jgi:hypothetical protein
MTSSGPRTRVATWLTVSVEEVDPDPTTPDEQDLLREAHRSVDRVVRVRGDEVARRTAHVAELLGVLVRRDEGDAVGREVLRRMVARRRSPDSMCSSGSSGGVRYRGPIVERLLTDKHIRAWTMFIDSSADVLLALEDDAVFLPDSLHRLAALLARVKTNIADPVYVDLAGGFPLRKIVGVSTGSEDSAGLTAFDVPFTNTTCGYLVTRPLVISMLEQLTWRPELRDVGIDWLMNELMMRAHLVMPIICLHSDPPLFNHGSLTGAYPSDIVMRPITKRDP